eukprot:CFRG4145T1
MACTTKWRQCRQIFHILFKGNISTKHVKQIVNLKPKQLDNVEREDTLEDNVERGLTQELAHARGSD